MILGQALGRTRGDGLRVDRGRTLWGEKVCSVSVEVRDGGGRLADMLTVRAQDLPDSGRWLLISQSPLPAAPFLREGYGGGKEAASLLALLLG